MDYVFSVIGGVSCKLYDEISDNNLEVPETLKEALKGIQWLSLTGLSMHDFNFSILFYIICLCGHFNDKTAYFTPYEKSLLYVFPILIIISYINCYVSNVSDSFNYVDILPMLFFTIMCSLEPHYFPEEFSFRKLVSRLVAFTCIISLFYLGVSNSMIKILIYTMSYGVVSLLFQGLLISGLVKRNEIGASAGEAGEEEGEGKAIPNPSNT